MSIKSSGRAINILYVSPFPEMGGGEISLLSILKNLGDGFNPLVICYGQGRFVDKVRESGIKIEVFKRGPAILDAALIRQIARFIRENRIDIVHVNCLDIRAGIAAWLSGAPLVGYLRVVFPFTWRDRLFVRMAQRVVAVSRVVVDEFCRGFSGLRGKFTVIPNAVEIPARVNPVPLRREFGLPDNCRLIGMAARYDPFKGHLSFIEAAAIVRKAMPESYFLIMGETGPDEESRRYKRILEEKIAARGLAPFIIFTGFRERILETFAGLDVLVVPSLELMRKGQKTAEGFGRVAIEGMAAGVPVVASDTGGLREIIEDGITGIKVPPAAPPKIAEAVVDLLQNRDKAARIVKEALRIVNQKYTIAGQIEALEKVYRGVRVGGSAGLRSAGRRCYFLVRLPMLWLIKLAIPPRKKAQEPIRKILLVRLDRLGDFVVSLPVIDNIRLAYPDAQIDALVCRNTAGLARMAQSLDSVVEYKDFITACHTIRLRHYDMVIDMLYDYTLKPALLAYLSGAALRLGFNHGFRGVFFTHPVAPFESQRGTMVQIQLKLLEPPGIPAVVKFPHLCPPRGEADGRLSLRLERPAVVIHPGAHYPSQRWKPERFAEIAKKIRQSYNAGVVIVTGPREQDIRGALSGSLQGAGIKFLSPLLRELVFLLAESDLLICNNSGPLHLAAALGVPTVSVMGPTDPVLWQPSPGRHAVIRKDIACGPCSAAVCRDHRCMDSITIEEVWESVQRVLGERV